MVSIFAKTIIDGKIKETYKYENNEDFSIDNFENYVKDICEYFDSPSPIVLVKHIRDYIMFGTSTFTNDDFVEKIHFEKLVLEVYK